MLSGQDFIPQNYNAFGKGIPYITGASNFNKEGILINRWTEFASCIAYCGDLLITCKGSIGAMSILTIEKAHIARQIMCIHKSEWFSVDYIKYFLQSEINSLKKNSKGVIPGIDRKLILNSILPLPPLAEQKRIVARLEELLKECDYLSDEV